MPHWGRGRRSRARPGRRARSRARSRAGGRSRPALAGRPPPIAVRSSADLAHRAVRAYEARVADPVLQLLVRDGVAHVARELIVRRAIAERLLEVPLPPREETGA